MIDDRLDIESEDVIRPPAPPGRRRGAASETSGGNPIDRKVQVLPDALANQIAAGEVVERPASVVKELVENAIDAGATRVTIEIAEAGKALVRVVDDGQGMGPEDAQTAVLRHATSKLRTVEDLAAIGTLGFRGEALPSIASVSAFTLITRRDGDEAAVKVTVVGGGTPEVSPAAAPVGTTVEVKDLFWNVPARLKFLKANGTEAGHVSQLVTSFALGHPHVHFRYVNDGKLALDFPPAKRVLERVVQALGKGARTELHEVSFDGVVQVTGFVSAPQFARGSPQHLAIFVNGRRVRDRTVQHAIVAAYGHELAPGRFPQAVLYVHLEPGQVDVNVHPTKSEVRFQSPTLVHDSVQRAVQTTLLRRPWQAASPLPLETGVAEPLPPARAPLPLLAALPGASEDASAPFRHATELRFGPPVVFSPAPAPASSDAPAPTPASPTARVLGQLRTGLVVVETDAGDVLVIDPEVAERLRLAGELRAQRSRGQLSTQPLLMPVALDLAPAAYKLLKTRQPDLGQIGLWVEPFGPRTFQILGMPAVLGQAAPGRVLEDVAVALLRAPRADADALCEVMAKAATPPRATRLEGAKLARCAFADERAIVKRLSLRELAG